MGSVPSPLPCARGFQGMATRGRSATGARAGGAQQCRTAFFWLALVSFVCSALEASVVEEVLKTAASVKDPRIVFAKPFITAETSQFGAKIEGTSVDGRGRVYAVDFGDKTWQIGQLSNEKGEVDQRLFYDGADEASYYNGIRFVPVPEDDNAVAAAAVVADKKGQVVQLSVSKRTGEVSGRVYCKDESMIEPNDVAVALKSGKVYSSGLNYAATTRHGDGDVWICERPGDGPIYSPKNLGSGGTVAEPTRLVVQGRANGIELSNDERQLFAAETWATDMKIYSNILYEYDVDPQTGRLSNKRPFFDMKDVDEELQGKAGDIDGVRIDAADNLFLVRNGEPGEVVKVSPGGRILQRIRLPGITTPTNIELGGPDGKTLFIVGKCKDRRKSDGAQVACVDVWDGNEVPGRAFQTLAPSLEKHDEL